MTDISTIPVQEMIEDYHASLLEFQTCERLLAVSGRHLPSDPRQIHRARRTINGLRDRLSGNHDIMVAILAELERREAPELKDLPNLPFYNINSQQVTIDVGFHEVEEQPND